MYVDINIETEKFQSDSQTLVSDVTRTVHARISRNSNWLCYILLVDIQILWAKEEKHVISPSVLRDGRQGIANFG